MGIRKRPYAFTEHGVAMLSSVLKSERAVEMNVLVDLVHDIQRLKNPPFTRAIGFVHPKTRKR